MAKLEDLAKQAGELEDESSGKSLKRRIQDATGIYDGRSDRTTPYTDDQVTKAVALYKLYGSYTRVSQDTGIPVQTLSSWINGKNQVLAKVSNLEEKVNLAYSKLIDNSTFLMSEAQKIIYEKLPQSSAAQAATIYGILADKTRYMTEGSRAGASTSLHFDLAGLSGDEQGALLDRVLQRQQQRQEEREAIDAEFTPVEQEEQEDQDARPEADHEKTSTDTDTDSKHEYKRQKRIRSAQKREQRELQKLQNLK